MLVAPIALQAARHGGLIGLHPRGAQPSQHRRIAAPRSPATRAPTIARPVLPITSLDTVSSCTFIWVNAFRTCRRHHARSATRRARRRTLERSTHVSSEGRPPRAVSVAHQLTNPLTIEPIAFAPADLPGCPRIDQMHLQPRTVQHPRTPESGTPPPLASHDVHTARLQPCRHRAQLIGEARKRTNRALVGALGHRDAMPRLAQTDPRTNAMSQPPRLLAPASHRSISQHDPRSCRVKPRWNSHSCIRGHGNPRAVSDSTPITVRTTLPLGCEDTTAVSASHRARPVLVRHTYTVPYATAGADPLTVEGFRGNDGNEREWRGTEGIDGEWRRWRLVRIIRRESHLWRRTAPPSAKERLGWLGGRVIHPRHSREKPALVKTGAGIQGA